MPNESDSNDAADDAKQSKTGSNADKSSKEQPTIAQEMRRDFRWFEFGSLIINAVLVVVGMYALHIYSGQLDQMKSSVNQTERAVILNMGQLAIANRNAKVSEDTLAEMKRGGTDTHNLAVAADTANQQSKAAARPWIGPVGGGPHSDIRFEPQKNGEIEATYIWRLNNSGKRPRSLCPGI
jgi:Tfp pilus assembly protein PilX